MNPAALAALSGAAAGTILAAGGLAFDLVREKLARRRFGILSCSPTRPPIVPVSLHWGDGNQMSGWALVDTGAFRTMVDSHALRVIGAPSAGSGSVVCFRGVPSPVAFYRVTVTFPGVSSRRLELQVVGYPLGDNRDSTFMVIGRDVLERSELTIKGPRARLEVL